jgi:hypothetical protein
LDPDKQVVTQDKQEEGVARMESASEVEGEVSNEEVHVVANVADLEGHATEAQQLLEARH